MYLWQWRALNQLPLQFCIAGSQGTRTAVRSIALCTTFSACVLPVQNRVQGIFATRKNSTLHL